MQRIHFNDVGVKTIPPEGRKYVNLRGCGGESALELPLGNDVAYGEIIYHVENEFTRRLVFFDVCHDFKLEEGQKGQKVGIVNWRKGHIYEDDKQDPYEVDGEVKQSQNPRLSEEDEIRYYGPPGQPVILTGEITAIFEGGKVFQHNINSCSGAIIVLLDKNQKESVLDGDRGCVFGVHAGGRRLTRNLTLGWQFLKISWKVASAGLRCELGM